RVATHLGTEHTELYVTPAEARAVIPTLPDVYDEPFADSSQIPTCLVSRLARRRVTVALSGDGGDELFGGYVRYAAADAVWRKASKVPVPVRRGVAAFVGAMWPEPVDAWAADALGALGWLRGRIGRRVRLRRLAGVLRFRDFGELYEDFMVHWKEGLVVGARGGRAEAYREGGGWPDRWAAMAAMDLGAYLPDDLLVKVDRASMAVGLEVRAPFLDPRVVEWALGLPRSLKLRKGLSKWVLRRVVYRHVPREWVDRPKMGFGVPMGEWLRGPLRDWAESLLQPRRLEGEGFLRPAPVWRLWLRHLDGRVDGHLPLWAVLMFQAWLEREAGSGRSG
ncbi:MAG: asparagine synthetase B family protein, partial [Planctomycetota bacterium]